MTESGHPQEFPLPHHRLGELTFREWELLILISEDYDNASIAKLTNLKSRSIINMRHRIGEKIELKGRNKLGQFARQHREAIRFWFEVMYPPRNIKRR